MERLKIPEKAKAFLDKYKYVLLILLLGIVLMAIPEKSESESVAVPDSTYPEETQPEDFAAALEEILGQIQGAGEVRVLLSEETGAKTVYQTDTDSQTNDQSSSVRVETVIVSQGSGVQGALVVQVNPGTYRGAVVLCQGADDPAIKLQILDAVSKATGLGTHQISVLKLK